MLLMVIIFKNDVLQLVLSLVLYIGGTIIYKSKTQSITAGSSTEAKFIAAHTVARLAPYLRMLLNQL